MTEVIYPGTFSDQRGSEPVAFRNDGATLWVNIRGVLFSGCDFDSLKPAPETPTQLVGSFEFDNGYLCRCDFVVKIPVPVVLSGTLVPGVLTAELNLGAPVSKGGLEYEKLQLVLTIENLKILSSGESGWFEDEMLDIQRQLPAGAYLKACINCLYSDYSPYGHGLFGNMLCFRNIKDEYLRVRSKETFWAVFGREDRQVQETYLCDQFVLRVAGTGYRG